MSCLWSGRARPVPSSRSLAGWPGAMVVSLNLSFLIKAMGHLPLGVGGIKQATLVSRADHSTWHSKLWLVTKVPCGRRRKAFPAHPPPATWVPRAGTGPPQPLERGNCLDRICRGGTGVAQACG